MKEIKRNAMFADVKDCIIMSDSHEITEVFCGPGENGEIVFPFMKLDDKYLIGLDIYESQWDESLGMGFDFLEFKTEEEFNQHMAKLNQAVSGSAVIENFDYDDLGLDSCLDEFELRLDCGSDEFWDVIKPSIGAIAETLYRRRFYARWDGKQVEVRQSRVPDAYIDDDCASSQYTRKRVGNGLYVRPYSIFMDPVAPIIIADSDDDDRTDFYYGLDLVDGALKFVLLDYDFWTIEEMEKYYQYIDNIFSYDPEVQIAEDFGIYECFKDIPHNHDQLTEIVAGLAAWKEREAKLNG